MFLTASNLSGLHQTAMPYEQYVQTGKPNEQENWRTLYNRVALSESQSQLVAGFTRRMNILGVSGTWCGDCVQQCPLIQRIAEANPEVIDLRWVDRDAYPQVRDELAINAGHRVPVLVFSAEDFEPVSTFGDRTLSRYRAMAAKQLGGACPMPGAELPADELAATLQDWLDEFERVQLLLRLSTRLRQKHGD
jgi:thiol-disulfide isomerase/thioredoxin